MIFNLICFNLLELFTKYYFSNLIEIFTHFISCTCLIRDKIKLNFYRLIFSPSSVFFIRNIPSILNTFSNAHKYPLTILYHYLFFKIIILFHQSLIFLIHNRGENILSSNLKQFLIHLLNKHRRYLQNVSLNYEFAQIITSFSANNNKPSKQFVVRALFKVSLFVNRHIWNFPVRIFLLFTCTTCSSNSLIVARANSRVANVFPL